MRIQRQLVFLKVCLYFVDLFLRILVTMDERFLLQFGRNLFPVKQDLLLGGLTNIKNFNIPNLLNFYTLGVDS